MAIGGNWTLKSTTGRRATTRHRTLTFEQYKAHYAPPVGKPGEADHVTIVVRPETVIGFIGYLNADRRIGKVEVGIGIGEKAYWGKGYGREAMRLLRLGAESSVNRSPL